MYYFLPLKCFCVEISVLLFKSTPKYLNAQISFCVYKYFGI